MTVWIGLRLIVTVACDAFLSFRLRLGEVGILHHAAGKQAGKEIVSQLARGVFIAAIAAEEADDRRIIGRAQFTERRARPGLAAARAGDERPAGVVKRSGHGSGGSTTLVKMAVFNGRLRI